MPRTTVTDERREVMRRRLNWMIAREQRLADREKRLQRRQELLEDIAQLPPKFVERGRP